VVPTCWIRTYGVVATTSVFNRPTQALIGNTDRPPSDSVRTNSRSSWASLGFVPRPTHTPGEFGTSCSNRWNTAAAIGALSPAEQVDRTGAQPRVSPSTATSADNGANHRREFTSYPGCGSGMLCSTLIRSPLGSHQRTGSFATIGMQTVTHQPDRTVRGGGPPRLRPALAPPIASSDRRGRRKRRRGRRRARASG
jgi:hypothetical protein